MNNESADTYATRLDQYKRRERLITYVAAAFAGEIACIAAGALDNSPHLFKGLFFLVVIIGAGALAMAYVRFEWRATLLLRDIKFKNKNESDKLKDQPWPRTAENLWVTALFCIFTGGILVIFGAWWPVVTDISETLRTCSGCSGTRFSNFL